MLNCIHIYLTSTKPMVGYKAGQDFTQKVMTYVQDYVLKISSQHMYH